MSVNVEELYTRYGPMVLRRCRKMLGQEEDAVDAMQEVFVRVIEYQSKLDDSAPSSLLYRMATNVCLNRIRSSTRRPEVVQGDLILQIAQLSDTEERVMGRSLLDRIFGRHKESTRVIATLYWVDGMTYEEVAHEVGMSVSGVRKRLRQLREDAQLPEVD